MDLRWTPEQEAIRSKVRQFAQTEVASAIPQMERDDEHAFPAHLVARMAELGLMGIPIAAEWGGAGADFISYIIAIHELAKASAAVGVILSVHTSVGTLPILKHGTDEQRHNYVNRLASGKWLGAFALTEPQAGSDAASIRMTATREEDGYRLNGAKLFITNGGAADVYLTFAVTDASRGTRGISAFLVGRDTPGFQVGRRERKMGLHGSSTCELLFDDVRLSADERLGGEGEGFAIAMGALDGGRIGIGAQALGIAESALQLLAAAVRRSRSGTASQQRTIAPPAARAALAELTARGEAARLLVYRAAALRQQGRSCTKEASMAKLFASDTAVEVTTAAVRWCGERGFAKPYAAERLFRDAKVTQIYEGTNEIHRIVIGNQLLR
ncbi:acyl-CoA dehydrogenase [Paenibacillus sp. CCS19]|uniref:acyl-CoA dehydrogenase family protein n=1 Tax=Paenibacillus sp. CCS19 TaxID=3158387 RepID=UPI00256370EA|nr:acyl-CoA dehydrogenase family protein [Paenibacillus cellulosilyticus]GMK37196.1 acyl-CoA dehydrogenase [Paenibacillus cellulosilyticus]